MNIVSQNKSRCPVCSGTEALPLCTSNGYEILRCGTCACDFVWPMPDKQALKAYYDDEDYFHSDTVGSYTDYDFNTEAVIPLFRDFLLTIPNAAGKKILDIGCAFGTHLALAAQHGWDAWGVELSDHAREIALSRHGEKIRVVETIDSLPKMEFDLVIMLDVLEHLSEPYELFIELFLHGAIGKKTQLIITTPNARSADALVDPAGWSYRHPPAHLVYFSADSLRLFLNNLEGSEISIQGIYSTEQRKSQDYLDESNVLNQDFKNYAGLMSIVQGFDTSLHKLVAFFKGEHISMENAEISTLYKESFAIQKEIIQKQALKEQYLNVALTRRAQKIAGLIELKDGALAEQAQEIGRLNEVVIAKDAAITEQAQEIGRLHKAIIAKDANVAEQGRKITHLNEAIEAKEIELAEKEEVIRRIHQSKWHRLGAAIKTRPITLYTLATIIYLVLSLIMPSWLRNQMKVLVSKWHQYRLQQQTQINSSQYSSSNDPYLLNQPLSSIESRPRIIHVIANFHTGGSSRLVTDLIEYLGAYYEQSVFTSFIPTPPAYIGLDITEYRFPVDELPFIEHFAQVKPALIHVHYWGDCDESWYIKAFKAAEQLGIPVVENINTPIAPYLSSIVTHYVYVSDYVRRKFGKDDPTHLTIYPGSDFAHFYCEEREKQVENCVGMVYRLEPDKLNKASILPFIRAVQKRPNTQVLIVGGGSLLGAYKQMIAEAGVMKNFEFTDYVSYAKLPELYSRMAVFVAPVWKESFGQVSSFAMNMKIPVCGYDVGAIGEIVDNSALLAPADDAERLAEIIVRLLDSPSERKAVGEQLHKRAQEYFSVQSMIGSYRDIYQHLTGVPAK